MRLSRLYAIVCADACERRDLDLLQVARALCVHRPAVLQLRAKERPARQVLQWLRQLRPLTQSAGTLLFANDRADLAQLSFCDGVHVGQDDLPVSEVRAHFPDLRVGVSTHDSQQMESALDDAPDYVALGPIFPTGSKEDHDAILGLSGLRRIGRQARNQGIELVAIGGIGPHSIDEVLEAASRVALISALLPAHGSSGGALQEAVAERIAMLFPGGERT